MDPGSAWSRSPGRCPAGARSAPGAGTWAEAARDGQLALAHELVGAAGAMLELARAHALERVQFGHPIGSFQAVGHRLADTLVAIEAAGAALAAAWDDPVTHGRAVAKALAGRAARTAARHGQQVLAGIGFTTEHPLHRYVRRVLVLDELFGSSRSLTREIGRQLIEARRLPPPPPPLSGQWSGLGLRSGAHRPRGTSRKGTPRSNACSRGMPRTRSLMTLRAISVVPPPMHDTWRIRKSVPQIGHVAVVGGPGPPASPAISKAMLVRGPSPWR